MRLRGDRWHPKSAFDLYAERVILNLDNYGCYGWSGQHDWAGYAVVRVGGRKGRMERAHRISWERSFGPIPDGQSVLHHCDNRECSRPSHLFLGTQADNLADMRAKGRHRPGRVTGERHHSARLNDEQVRQLRDQYDRGASPLALATTFGISTQSVWRIGTRRSRRDA
jgi:hypothetical protein